LTARPLVPHHLRKLIDSLSQLPGIGRRSSQRIAFFLLSQGARFGSEFGRSVQEGTQNIARCKLCALYTDEELCPLCENPSRDRAKLCIVEYAVDIYTIEKAKVYNGLYHSLEGLLAPLDGVGPDKIRIKELRKQIKENCPEEVIIALPSSLEGETTAKFLKEDLRAQLPEKDKAKVKISRIAFGLPAGAGVEFADRATMKQAMDFRTSY